MHRNPASPGLCVGDVAGRAFAAVVVASLVACGEDPSAARRPACVERVPPVEWTQETQAASWAVRDSAAEVVFKDRMWLMGGWFDSFQATPTDVWSSADGRRWQQVTAAAPWRHGDLAAAVTFNGRMWLLSGWSGGRLPGASATNEVWVSDDGAKWHLAAMAPWSARLGTAAVEFRGRLWVVGGVENYYFGDAGSLRNDVWSSSDGVEWTEVTRTAPWAPRAYHAALVFNDRLWVIGGGNYTPNYVGFNDVWSSSDGEEWRLETAAAPWHERIWFSTAVYRGYLWVLGGWSGDPYQNWGDAWYSRDGVHWAQLEHRAVWKPRHEHSTYVFDDRLFVVGGFAGLLVNDAWSLLLPVDWVGACSAQVTP